MNLVTRQDRVPLGGLAVALIVVFARPIRDRLDVARAVEWNAGLALETAAMAKSEGLRAGSKLRSLSDQPFALRPTPLPDRTHARAYLAWLAVCLIWGTTYLGIRISLETIPPLLMAAMRWIAAGGLLILLLALRGERLPARREWPSLAILGILLLGFGNGAVVWAEQTVPSGLTAVLVATSPFWMVGFDALMPDGDPLTPRRVLGLVVGFGGIVMLVWPEIRFDGSGGGFLSGVVAAQIACIGWAVGSSYARKRGRGHAREENVLATAALEMLFGGIALLIVSLALREPARLTFTLRTGSALLYLVLVGAIGGFSAYAYALKHLPVATVSLYAYINPIIAVILGALVLREAFSVRMVAAALIVLGGSALVRSE